jgi:ribonuclease HII
MYIIGADEVGYGTGVGSIVICAVRANKEWNLNGLMDSKKLKAISEEKLIAKANELKEIAKSGEIEYYIAERDNNFIDKHKLGFSQKECFIEAVNFLWRENSEIIIDGNLKFPPNKMPSQVNSIEKADTIIPTVMAASIIAKVHKDEQMRNLHKEYSEYGWDKNIGYLSSKVHKDAIKKFGLTPYHRKSFKIKVS